MERASEMFEEKFRGNPNIFTPDVIRYEMCSPTVGVELSEGYGPLSDESTVAVTFLVRTLTGELRVGGDIVNECFFGLDAMNEAEDRVTRVKALLLGSGE